MILNRLVFPFSEGARGSKWVLYPTHRISRIYPGFYTLLCNYLITNMVMLLTNLHRGTNVSYLACMKTDLLILLFACHWLADYTHLSTAWMLSAKRLGKPLFPIFCHAGMHAGLMGFALMTFGVSDPLLWRLVALQWTTHFLIDMWKGRMNVWLPALQSPANKWHWVVFGLDQFLHAVVIIIMASTI